MRVKQQAMINTRNVRYSSNLGVIALVLALTAPAAAFESFEHQDAGDVGARAAFKGIERLHPSLALPWRDSKGRVLVGSNTAGPAIAAGRELQALTFGELVAIYADVVDQGGGQMTPALDQMAASSSHEIQNYRVAIGRTFDGGFDPNDPITKGRGLELLSVNASHFTKEAVKTYLHWHRLDIAEAAEAARSGDLSHLWRALHTDALGAHSLTDLFAPGHSVLDRKESIDLQQEFDRYNQVSGGGMVGTLTFVKSNLKSWIFDPNGLRLLWSKLKGAAMAVFTGFLHDSYNSNGAWLYSLEKPQGWQAYGDSGYGKSLENLELVRAAAYRTLKSLLDVYVIFKTRVAPERFKEAVAAAQQDPMFFDALRLVPTAYRSAQRFEQPKTIGQWAALFAAVMNKMKGYGAGALGRDGFLKMQRAQAGNTLHRAMVLEVLDSSVSIRKFLTAGPRDLTPAHPPIDLSTRTHPFNPVVIGLHVVAPFSTRKTPFNGVVREIYGGLARVAFASGGENWAPLEALSPGAPKALPAPTAPNHIWKVGARVRAPLATPYDLYNGTVRAVYGKLVHVEFDTKDIGWALGLRCRNATATLIPAALHPRALLKPLAESMDKLGESLLGVTGYAWLRDTLDGLVTRTADRVKQGLSTIAGWAGDAAIALRGPKTTDLRGLAKKLVDSLVTETEIMASEFRAGVNMDDMKAHPELVRAVSGAWQRLIKDVSTLSARSMQQGIEKVRRWYPTSTKKRAAGVNFFNQAYAAESGRILAQLKHHAQALGIAR